VRRCVIIPGFNVANQIGGTLKELLGFFPHARAIWVIDDGSRDETASVARRMGVQVVSHPFNRGKGAALKTGFEIVAQRGYECVVTMDADGQHPPKYVPLFFETIERGPFDLVIGTRNLSLSAMPFDRYLSNQLSSVVVSLVSGRRIRDSQSGFRALRLEVIKGLTLRTNHFETESELLIQACRRNLRIGFLPIETVYDSEGSSIHRLVDTFRFVRLILRTLILGV